MNMNELVLLQQYEVGRPQLPTETTETSVWGHAELLGGQSALFEKVIAVVVRECIESACMYTSRSFTGLRQQDVVGAGAVARFRQLHALREAVCIL